MAKAPDFMGTGLLLRFPSCFLVISVTENVYHLREDSAVEGLDEALAGVRYSEGEISISFEDELELWLQRRRFLR